MPNRGAASINKGVLIALTNLNTLHFNEESDVVSIGPANRWQDVNAYLQPRSRLVLGGRVDTVGTSGFFLGGGISFFSGLLGWGANSVVNYEIVISNGSVLNANKSSHSDLWWALKGGFSNFGIVTRFDVQTYPLSQVFGGTIFVNDTGASQFLDALASFTNLGGGIDDKEAGIMPSIHLYPSEGIIGGNAVIVRNGSESNPASLRNFTAIPLPNDVRLRNYSELVVTESGSEGSRHSRWSFMTTAFVASQEAVYLANETLSQPILDRLADVEGRFVALSMQPINWAQQSKDMAGDAIDLDPTAGNFISFNIIVQWHNVADDGLVNKVSAESVLALEQTMKAHGWWYPFRYLNDAHMGQEVFSLYGNGSSLAKLRQIRSLYDPDAVFQRLSPGGFKVGL
ncbi:MAG: hypothetical protein Q9159_006304 [Coniocarpon cinnabarinum]